MSSTDRGGGMAPGGMAEAAARPLPVVVGDVSTQLVRTHQEMVRLVRTHQARDSYGE
ncbi:hypothetical protein [Streptomyces pseudoechinosporeus]